MAKTHPLPTFPRIRHLCPKSLEDPHFLAHIAKDPRTAYRPNSIDSDWPYLAYTPEEAFLRVLELLAVPVNDNKLSKARKKAIAAIRAYLDGLLKQ
jgi:hypothetical protein